MNNPGLAVASFLVLLLHALPHQASAADDRSFSILPFQRSEAPAEESSRGVAMSSFLSLLVARQTGWTANLPAEPVWPAITWLDAESPPADKMGQLSRSLNSTAVVTGTYREQAGTLRIQADLYRPGDIGEDALRFNLSGKTGKLPEMLTGLSALIGEALEFRFLRRLRPPVPGKPVYLLSFEEPAIEARDPEEDTVQTETFLLSALKIDPNNADAHYQLGTLRARTGRLDEGITHFTAAVDLRPQHSPYYYSLGIGQYMQGLTEEALTSFLQATVIDDTFFEGFLALGRLHRELGDYEAAREAFRKAGQLRPGDPFVSLAFGITACLEKKPDEARQHFVSAREAAPRFAAAYINLGVLELEEGNIDIARREFAKALASSPDSPEALNNMALLESRRGLTAEAAEKFATAEKGGRHRAQIITNLGSLQMASGLWDEAAETFLRALERDPAFAPALNNLGIIRLVESEIEASLSRFYAGLKSSPGSALLHYNLALVHQLTGADQQALVHYLKAVKARRVFVEAHTNLGILFEELDRPEKALTEYLKVLSATQNDPEIYTYLGLNYARRGYQSMAAETIRKATLVEGKIPAPYYYLAVGKEGQDDSGAADVWRQFISKVRQDPNRSFWIPFAEKRLADLGASP